MSADDRIFVMAAAAASSLGVGHGVEMVEPPHDSSVDDFFIRSGLTPKDQLDCYKFIDSLYPSISWKQAPCQGYCSLTVFVGEDVVIQFRPHSYRLNLQIVNMAKQVYGPFAPDTEHIATIPGSGLLVYGMNRIAGASLKLVRGISSVPYTVEHRVRLCVDLASFMSRAWSHGKPKGIHLGMIGTSIPSRLDELSSKLPIRFRPVAEQILMELPVIQALPWVLTHGDIVPGNVIIDPSSGRLVGFVDWAEAELLPFGICFYGLEEILGEMSANGFQYHVRAMDLRRIFWDELKKCIPELLQTSTLRAVRLARDLGVLLWYGIAFDNGAIDRVVQEGRDVDEIQKLEAFLGLSEVSVKGV